MNNRFRNDEMVLVVHPSLYQKLMELFPTDEFSDPLWVGTLAGYKVYVEDTASLEHIEYMDILTYYAKYGLRKIYIRSITDESDSIE